MIILYRVESDRVAVSGSDEISEVKVDGKLPGVLLVGATGTYELRFTSAEDAKEFLEKMIRVVESAGKVFAGKDMGVERSG